MITSGNLYGRICDFLASRHHRGRIVRPAFYRFRVSDPDPDWIRIQSGQWIRIRIRNPDSDPDPGGQKWPTKVEKFMFWSVGWPLLWGAGFFCNLDILYVGLVIGKLQFLIKKFFFFFSAVIFFNFWSLKPWIWIGSGSVSVSSLNLWIRIRKKWIRIRNTG